ncbi:MAG: hypothetical protein HQK83_02855 [Fibrobacteria bacterium]|nr:hypothetical protein [Fibrobacteria bacterium]
MRRFFYIFSILEEILDFFDFGNESPNGKLELKEQFNPKGGIRPGLIVNFIAYYRKRSRGIY